MPSFALHQGFAGNSVSCNPWNPTQYIIAAGNNFSITGSGKVYILGIPSGCSSESPVQFVGCFGTRESAFHASFSTINSNIVSVGCGKGFYLYDISKSMNRDGVPPLVYNREHNAEVSCVCWNPLSKQTFLTSSWDRTIKLFSVASIQSSIRTYNEHMKEVYEVSNSPQDPSLFLSCSGDGHWKLWDIRQARSSLSVVGHRNQIILSIDWNKHNPTIFATGGVDHMTALWDVRKGNAPFGILNPPHEGAVRQVRFSPHSPTDLVTGGYDFRACVWDLSRPQNPLIARYEQYREFVTGLSWSYTEPKGIVSTSWDGMVFFFTSGQSPTFSRNISSNLPIATSPPWVR